MRYFGSKFEFFCGEFLLFGSKSWNVILSDLFGLCFPDPPNQSVFLRSSCYLAKVDTDSFGPFSETPLNQSVFLCLNSYSSLEQTDSFGAPCSAPPNQMVLPSWVRLFFDCVLVRFRLCFGCFPTRFLGSVVLVVV